MKMILKILCIWVIFYLHYFSFVYWAIQSVECSSSEYFSQTCTQCFHQDTPIYQWGIIAWLKDTWYTFQSNGSRAYLDENPISSIVKINHFYNKGEVYTSSWSFEFSPNLRDWDPSNWEIYTDSNGRQYMDFLPGTSWEIVRSQNDFYIELQNISDDIKQKWRTHPIFEFSYNIEFYNLPNTSTQRHHQECILYYPAWCWDGILSDGEVCDYGILPWNSWYNPNCSQTCTFSNACEIWNINLPLSHTISSDTLWLCQSWKWVGDFSAFESWDSIYYSWSCNNSDIWGACQATYIKPKEPIIIQKTSCERGNIELPLNKELLQETSWLCKESIPVSNFKSNKVDNVIYYMWSCWNSTIGWNCQASYEEPIILKEVVEVPNCEIWNLLLPLTQELKPNSPWLCNDGERIWNFWVIRNVEKYTYTWSCGNSKIWGACSAQYIPTQWEKEITMMTSIKTWPDKYFLVLLLSFLLWVIFFKWKYFLFTNKTLWQKK